MHFRHDHTVRRWRTAGSRLSAATVRRRTLNAGGAGILALLFLPLLGVASAQAQAGQITEFKVTEGGIDGGPLTLGADGDLYFGTGFPATIGRITPSGQVTQFADPDTAESNVSLTAAGPDGNVWFADSGNLTQGELGRVTPAGQVTMFSIPMFDGERTLLEGLAAGPDGNLWFTADAIQGRTVAASLVGKVNPATGAITEFAIPSGASDPGPITVGSDGNLWFPEVNLPGVARVTTH